MRASTVAQIALVVVATSASRTEAQPIQFELARDILHLCKSDNNALRMACFGFVKGFISAVRISTAMSHDPMPFCISRTLSFGELTDTIVRSLEARANILDQPSHVVVMDILERAYPCEADNG
jgi:hypothetical protein